MNNKHLQQFTLCERTRAYTVTKSANQARKRQPTRFVHPKTPSLPLLHTLFEF